MSIARMSIDWIRERCLALPHVTEDVKWETNLVFSVAEKMFAITALPGPHAMGGARFAGRAAPP